MKQYLKKLFSDLKNGKKEKSKNHQENVVVKNNKTEQKVDESSNKLIIKKEITEEKEELNFNNCKEIKLDDLKKNSSPLKRVNNVLSDECTTDNVIDEYENTEDGDLESFCETKDNFKEKNLKIEDSKLVTKKECDEMIDEINDLYKKCQIDEINTLTKKINKRIDLINIIKKTNLSSLYIRESDEFYRDAMKIDKKLKKIINEGEAIDKYIHKGNGHLLFSFQSNPVKIENLEEWDLQSKNELN